MLKCRIKKSGIIRVKASGTVDDLVPEIGMIVLEVYRNIRKKNPAAAKEFRNRMIGLLLDPDSPVWKEA